MAEIKLFDYLKKNSFLIKVDRQGKKELEQFVVELSRECDNFETSTLNKILNANGWQSSGYFTESMIVEMLRQDLGNYCIENNIGSSFLNLSLGQFVPRSLQSEIKTTFTQSNNLSLWGILMRVDLIDFVDSSSNWQYFNFLKMHSLWNNLVSSIIQKISIHGGDVISTQDHTYIECIFVDGPTQTIPACVRACQCGLELSKVEVDLRRPRVALHSGSCSMFVNVNANCNYWTYFVHGVELLALAECVSHGSSGDVVVTESCCQHLGKQFADLSSPSNGSTERSRSPNTGLQQQGGPLIGKYAEVTLCGDSEHCIISRLRPLPLFSGEAGLPGTMSATDNLCCTPAALLVPPPVADSYCSGHPVRCAVMRCVVVCTMSLSGIQQVTNRSSSSSSSIIHVSELLESIQEALALSGGWLKSVRSEEDDCWLLQVVFGAPLASFGDNTARAIRCACCTREMAALKEWKFSAGIASEQAMCSIIGCLDRMEYYILSPAVAQSTKLLIAAKKNGKGTIYLSEMAWNQLSGVEQRQVVHSLASLEDEQVYLCRGIELVPGANSGKVLHVSVAQALLFTTLAQHLDNVSNALSPRHAVACVNKNCEAADSPTISFTYSSTQYLALGVEKSILLYDISEFTAPSCVVIVGSAGTGKSTALHHVQAIATRRSLSVVHVQCHHGEDSAQFSVIAQLLLHIIGFEQFDTEAKQRMVLGKILADIYGKGEAQVDTRRAGFITLTSIMGLSWASFVYTPQQTDLEVKSTKEKTEQRLLSIDATVSCILGALKSAMSGRKLVVTIDDGHYCDDMSWQIIHQILSEVKSPVAIFITSRFGINGSGLALSRARIKSGDQACEADNECGEEDSRNPFPTIARLGADRDDSSMGSFSSKASSIASVNCSLRDPHESGQRSDRLVKSAAYYEILRLESCYMIELALFDEAEVRESLLRQVSDKIHVTSELEEAVHKFTGGIPYWCHAIAEFIRSHGVEAFQSSVAVHSTENNQGKDLATLITLRFDMLSSADQLVAKYASVVGEQFTWGLLKAILPPEQEKSWECLEDLRSSNFINLRDQADMTYAFQNALIHATIYNSIPLELVRSIHLAIAQHLDAAKSQDFPILHYHYKKGDRRQLAFKYAVESSKKFLKNGAYSAGFSILECALPLAITRAELKQLIVIADDANALLHPPLSITALLRRQLSKSEHAERQCLIHQFDKLRADIDATIAYMSKNGESGSTRKLVPDEDESDEFNPEISFSALCCVS